MLANLNYIHLFHVKLVDLYIYRLLKIAKVKFERKFLITVKMLQGKWILFWNSTVITNVQVHELFF